MSDDDSGSSSDSSGYAFTTKIKLDRQKMNNKILELLMKKDTEQVVEGNSSELNQVVVDSAVEAKENNCKMQPFVKFGTDKTLDTSDANFGNSGRSFVELRNGVSSGAGKRGKVGMCEMNSKMHPALKLRRCELLDTNAMSVQIGTINTSNLEKPRSPSTAVIIIEDDEDANTETTVITDDDNRHRQENIEINPIVTVKVFWRFERVDEFKVRKYQKLTSVFNHYQQETGKSPKLLLFTLRDMEISLQESTYASLNLNASTHIEGGILPEKYLFTEAPTALMLQRDDDSLSFSVQTEARRNNLFSVSLSKSDNMALLIAKVSEEVRQPHEKVKLYFDGVLVKPRDTMEALELEGGECFDLIVSH